MAALRLKELDNEQRRQLIDVKQVYSGWRRASRRRLPGSYRWVTRKGHEYLYRKYKNSERSLGRRSSETEAIMQEQIDQRLKLKGMGERLKTMARVNRALFLNRVPKDASLILRELDAADLLGKHLFVIGTNALFAYEMRSGVLFENALLATHDFDLLWDARDQLRLLVSGISPDGVLGILRKADPTFSSADDYGTPAQNKNGYFVDLFCPPVDPTPDRLTPNDIDPIPVEGSDWLLRAPKFEETVIGWDGMPQQMYCIDPRVFALHKLWLSRQPSRQEQSRSRDVAQARAVAAVATAFLRMRFDDPALSRLPKALKALGPALQSADQDLQDD